MKSKMDNMNLQTVDRALMILEMIAQKPMTQAELEKETGFNRTTMGRLVYTLANRKYIEKDANTNRYGIGLKVVELGSIKLNQIELKTEAVPLLRELSQKVNQVCHMGVLNDGEVVYIEKIEPLTSIRMFSAIGKRVPVHATSLGKMLMSGLANTEIIKTLSDKGMEKFTVHTILNQASYLQEIEKVRTQGYAVDDAENEDDIYCVSAPIFDYRNRMIAAISTTGTNKAVLSAHGSKTIDAITDTALQVSKRMGFKL